MLDILFAVAALLLTSYLVYIRVKHVPVMDKYKPGTPNHDLYQKIYSFQFLKISIITTVLAIADLVFVVKHPTNSTELYVFLSFFALKIVGAGVVIFLMYTLFRQPKKILKVKK